MWLQQTPSGFILLGESLYVSEILKKVLEHTEYDNL